MSYNVPAASLNAKHIQQLFSGLDRLLLRQAGNAA
jgi:hypothetical protein